MGNMKTPGVYIQEKNAFPNSVVEVATAVPAFIGYTEFAMNKGNSLDLKPRRITSMAEFELYFGGPPTVEHVRFSLTKVGAVAKATGSPSQPLPGGTAAPAPAPGGGTAAQPAGTPAVAAAPVSAPTDGPAPAPVTDGPAPAPVTGGPAPAPVAGGTASPAPVAGPTAPAEPKPPKPLVERDAEALRVRADQYHLTQTSGFYLLYYSMRLFFKNGGGPCYVVSVGTYQSTTGILVDGARLEAGLKELEKELEPTMVVVPEAVLLDSAACFSLQAAMLLHCGTVMKNRIALLDVWEGYQPTSNDPNVIDLFRQKVVSSTLAFGAAYYPWLNTTVVQPRELSYENIDTASQTTLIQCIKDGLAADGITGAKLTAFQAEAGRIATATSSADKAALADSLTAMSEFFKAILGEMARRLSLLPPSPAMAGIYTVVDNARGVWKAPANVPVLAVDTPSVPISSEQQEGLNVTPQGKSINAIRSFIGEGTLVWGARTLDGNSLDWRYINVRRTMIFLEESIRLAAKAMVFEPNVAGTWVTMKGMIGNFLTGIWKRGGLAGAVPEDAFSVHVGLGETMTPEDILEGILRVTVLVAISRPAEFIEITFQQQMQKS